MLVSGYTGYTLGFGDAFGTETFGSSEYSFNPSINVGGIFNYGVSDKLMIGGEIGFQNYSEKYSDDYVSESYGYNNYNFLFNGLYALNYDENLNSMFITFGAGFYGAGEGDYKENNFGIFGGVVYQKMMTPSMGIFIMPRFHYVFAEDIKPTMLSLSVGLSFPLGQKSE